MTHLHESRSDIVFVTFCYIFVTSLAIVTAFPFWEQMVLSISNRADANRIGLKLFTANPDFTAYRQIWSSSNIWRSAWNSVVRVVTGTALSVTLTALTAYPLSKKKFLFNKQFTLIILFTMIFSGGLIPGYLLITKQLHLTDTLFALILPGAVGAYNLIIVRNFLRTIPASLEESARIDGAGDFRIWWSIVLPLSTAVLATVSLWVAVGHWNAYFDSLLYTRDTSKYVLQIFLRRVLLEQQMDMLADGMIIDMSAKPTEISVRAALIVFSTLPIVIVYPFLQKYFVKGIMLGSVKG